MNLSGKSVGLNLFKYINFSVLFIKLLTNLFGCAFNRSSYFKVKLEGAFTNTLNTFVLKPLYSFSITVTCSSPMLDTLW